MLAPTAHARHARVGVCVIASALPSCHPRKRQLSAAARRFFKCAVGTNGIPDRIAIDKSGANLAGLQSLNVILRYTGAGRIIGIVQSKYLNNIIEPDHRFIKKLARQMKGFNAASATLEGIEVAHMIRKQQFETSGQSAFKKFAALAG